MYCIDTGAIAFMFNRGSSWAISEKNVKFEFIGDRMGKKHFIFIIFDGLDGVKGPLLACMTHMNHEMYMHLCFLAPQVYLCSASLTLNI